MQVHSRNRRSKLKTEFPLMRDWQASMDQAAVRYTAGAALLRLARHHDDRIPVDTFHQLSLTLQVGC